MLNFDAILEATESSLRNGTNGVQIISENHDISSINWVAGMSDPGEMIRCGYLPQLRRKAGEADREYQDRLIVLIAELNPLDRAKLNALGVGSAEARADLDTSNGRVNVFYVGEPAWHEVGVRVAQAINSEQAITLAGQNFIVEKIPVQYAWNGEQKTRKNQFVLVRMDTGADLGQVSSKYQVIQNVDGYKFLDAVMAKYGAAYHTAGSLHGGAKVFMQVALPNQSFEVVKGDEVSAYATFVNSHDGTSAAFCFSTTERAVCKNTLRRASRDKSKGIRMPHTGDLEVRIAEAQAALGLVVEGFEEFKEQADVLVRTPVADVKGYFGGVLDAVLDITAAQAQMGASMLAQKDLLDGVVANTEGRQKAEIAYAKAIENRSSILDDILDRYESERCGINGIRGSAWAALNAVTEHTNHYQTGRKVGTPEARNSRMWENVIAGERDDMNQVALAQALAIAG